MINSRVSNNKQFISDIPDRRDCMSNRSKVRYADRHFDVQTLKVITEHKIDIRLYTIRRRMFVQEFWDGTLGRKRENLLRVDICKRIIRRNQHG